jgi:arylsulfatase A-like enzyme
MKRYSIGVLATSVFLVPLAHTVNAQQTVPPGTPPPNVLIILTDDQRAAGTMEVMPQTRRLMGEGGTTYSNGVVTTPVCCPSRASIFTGQYVHNHGVAQEGNSVQNRNLDMTTTMQFELKQAGYQTAIAGKFLNGWSGAPPYFDKWAIFEGSYKPSTFNVNGTEEVIDTYSTVYLDRTASQFLDYFEERDDAPWFMQVSPFAPHKPSTPQKKYARTPVSRWSPNPAQSETDLSDKYSWVSEPADTKKQARHQRRHQLRSLMSVDDLVRDTFAKLDALGETDSTLVFYLSDNGWTWFDHQLNAKRYPYDQSVRVPFYVRWPGHVLPGAEDDRIAANIDIAPTVYQAAGIVPTYTVDGRSLFGPSTRSEMLMEYFYIPSRPLPKWRSLWAPTSTYIRYYESEGQPREYYGRDDPWQLVNVYHDGIDGNEPANEAYLDALLDAYATCSGASCP